MMSNRLFKDQCFFCFRYDQIVCWFWSICVVDNSFPCAFSLLFPRSMVFHLDSLDCFTERVIVQIRKYSSKWKLFSYFAFPFKSWTMTHHWSRERESNHQLDEKPVSFGMYVCIIKLIVEPLADGQSIDRQCGYIVESENWTRIINRSVVLLILYLLFLSSRSFFPHFRRLVPGKQRFRPKTR